MSHPDRKADPIGTRIELNVMHLLSKQPMAPKELMLALPYTENQIKYTVQALREAGCIYRMPCSHKMALTDL